MQYQSLITYRPWMGFGDAGGLARDRGGALTVFGVAEGVPKGKIQALYADAPRRRLWIGSREGGLGRIDDPGAERPRIVRITTAEGLSSDEILSLTGDLWGRVYAGSNRGVDRLDPDTGEVRRFTAADGLAKGEVLAAARDGEGALWFVTAHEASRLRPVAERQDASLPVFISGVRIAGIPMEISALGEAVVAAREFRARDTSLSIDFIALGFGAGDLPRYQYRLEGADREWSAPTEQRTVNYGGLTPGQYRFQVRAVTAAGTVSDPPAEVRFFLPRPVWQRWWFLALLSAITTAALYVAYRYRLAQLLQLERVRTRIASDLHDDIGANLTKISILSEVAKQQHGAGGENGLHPLTSIADLSRESVAAMSDIVWAINPRKDNLLDLVRRMRQHAEETLDAAGIALRFTVPEAGADLKLGADLRRQIYLIFKEALNNLVRHAHASRAAIALRVEGAALTLRIEDDGAGFDPTREFDGNGLPGMQKRAAGFGGEVRIESQPGRGAAVTLRVPLRPRRRFSLRI